MKIAVIGTGSWGKNLVRNFYELGVLKIVCDLEEDNLTKARERYPNLLTTSSLKDVIDDKEIDGIVIATPAHTHYEIAKQSLEAGHNVYVEKPLAQNVTEAKELHAIAENKNLTLMVGHLLLYHPAVNKLKQIIASGDLGTVQYVNSDRRNFTANHRKHSNVMWDLAPHDFSMMCYILNTEPEKIVNVRTWASSGDSIDVAHIDILFPNNIGGHIHNSWLDPQKQALLTVNGSRKTAVLNDTFKENKLEIYSRQEDGSLTVEKPVYSNDEPLRLECRHFLDCIEHKRKPTSDSVNGYQVVKYVETCQNFIH
ncbi:MAG: Gfo/Idh/MocA family oxidoreductase [Candidatus Melainabacteria bacterium]|jgi:UDP-2-acetamido-3-amino-2,3-dideoxy-glucuronate N-acetyltransferase|nr:Gfo/Idh/MocA family oxidoreductase [Candidatus Melainabacteria bacterium]